MAADVSTLVRILNRYHRGDGGSDEGSVKPDLVTRDLLGGCSVVGGGALQSPGTKKLPFPELHRLPSAETHSQSMDLNLPPLRSSSGPLPTVRMMAQDNSTPALDLRLRSLVTPPPPPPAEYQSVCTLEKVKSALERAGRETRRRQQHDPSLHASTGSASPTSSSTTSSSAKRRISSGGIGSEEGEGDSDSPLGIAKGDGVTGSDSAAEMAATGCPSCLMYVLISRWNPRCPGCSSAVPLPQSPQAPGKKPRIDLNASASAPAPSSSPIRTVKFF